MRVISNSHKEFLKLVAPTIFQIHLKMWLLNQLKVIPLLYAKSQVNQYKFQAEPLSHSKRQSKLNLSWKDGRKNKKR